MVTVLGPGEYRSQEETDAIWANESVAPPVHAYAPPIGRREHMRMAYHDARHAAELRREDVTMGYASETRDYNRDHNMPTWKNWLTSNAGSGAQ